MLSSPAYPEINHRTIKLIVGLIALLLAGVTDFLTGGNIESISASYHYGEHWPRNVFVGSLAALSALLVSYNGASRKEMILSKIAAVATLGVALFPCQCGDPANEIIRGVHAASAAVMFLILAYMCYLFYKEENDREHWQSNARKIIFAVCGLAIVAAIAYVTYGNIANWPSESRFVFYGEQAGLIAFGISWLVSSDMLPVLTPSAEQHHPFR